MILLGFKLYCTQLVQKRKVLAYSLHYSREKALSHLKKIAEFHGLKGKIVKSKAYEEKIKTKIENFILKRKKPRIKLSVYKYSKVYQELLAIPRGEAKSYSEIAKKVKLPIYMLIQALAHNPMLVLIPCHRLIRKDGKISGYTPLGKAFKKALLEAEGCKGVVE